MNPHRFNNVVRSERSLLQIRIGNLCSETDVGICCEVIDNINTLKVWRYGIKIGNINIDVRDLRGVVGKELRLTTREIIEN